MKIEILEISKIKKTNCSNGNYAMHTIIKNIFYNYQTEYTFFSFEKSELELLSVGDIIEID